MIAPGGSSLDLLTWLVVTPAEEVVAAASAVACAHAGRAALNARRAAPPTHANRANAPLDDLSSVISIRISATHEPIQEAKTRIHSRLYSRSDTKAAPQFLLAALTRPSPNALFAIGIIETRSAIGKWKGHERKPKHVNRTTSLYPNGHSCNCLG